MTVSTSALEHLLHRRIDRRVAGDGRHPRRGRLVGIGASTPRHAAWGPAYPGDGLRQDAALVTTADDANPERSVQCPFGRFSDVLSAAAPNDTGSCARPGRPTRVQRGPNRETRAALKSRQGPVTAR